jgi:hypothetical protein
MRAGQPRGPVPAANEEPEPEDGDEGRVDGPRAATQSEIDIAT